MDWLDYRAKLGIAFYDEQKLNYFLVKMFNVIDNIDFSIDEEEYMAFCDVTASELNYGCLHSYDGRDRFRHISNILRSNSKSLSDFLAYYIAFINVYKQNGLNFKDLLLRKLEESHIMYEIIDDDGNCFVFLKGAKELDNALVSEPLEWLTEYPKAHKAFIQALKDYSDITKVNASNIADSFRKALESFCQEFFNSKKSLENYKSDIGKFLVSNDIPKEISGNFEKILNSYCQFNNHYAKHRDATSNTALEFIMYQTGSFIRLLITCKK